MQNKLLQKRLLQTNMKFCSTGASCRGGLMFQASNIHSGVEHSVHLNIFGVGKMKPRKIESLLTSLSDRDLGPYGGGQYTSKSGSMITLTQCKLAELQPKVNVGKVVLGKVVCSVNSNDPVPFAFCMIDADRTCVAVMVYNLAQGAGMKIGDSVAIPEPLLKKVKVSHKETEICFTSIQVDSPRYLVVNGRKLGINKEALTVLSVSAVSD